MELNQPYIQSMGQGQLAVCARDFSFAYSGAANPVISKLCWEVSQGAFQLLIGATGSGKTTLLRNLVPAIAPVGTRSGSLMIFGEDVACPGGAVAAGTVGYVAQSPETQLVCDSVWHELAFGLENLGVAQQEMRLRVAEVAHFFGIESWFHKAVAQLSGGQKQLLALASVLVMKPRILLLDEPTSQLDPVAAKTFIHALFRVNRELGITVVLATHSPHIAADYASSAVRMCGGCLVEARLADYRANLEIGVCAAPPAQDAPSAQEVASSHEKGLERITAAHEDGSGRVADTRVAPQSTTVLAPQGVGPQHGACSAGSSSAVPQGKDVVVLRDVYVRYYRTLPWVLRGFDFQVSQGEIHAVLGGNGCGKSTLLQVIAGVLPAERGRVRNIISGSQAYLPQNPKALFAGDSVADELKEWQGSCGFGDAEVAAMAARFGLEPHLLQHPYDLSGGQQQLLALAKLLLTKPKLLLLDEPTKGLDPHAKCLLGQALLRAQKQGASIVLATHDLSFAALLANRISLMFDGQLATTLPTAQFFDGNLFYRPVRDGFAREWPSASDHLQCMAGEQVLGGAQ